MKNTIIKSPKIIIMCEWAGVSNNSLDIKKKKEDLLQWFIDHKFKFYQIGGNTTSNCTP